MGFVRIFWKNNVEEAYLPKFWLGPVFSEIFKYNPVVHCDDSIQVLLNLTWIMQLFPDKSHNFTNLIFYDATLWNSSYKNSNQGF